MSCAASVPHGLLRWRNRQDPPRSLLPGALTWNRVTDSGLRPSSRQRTANLRRWPNDQGSVPLYSYGFRCGWNCCQGCQFRRAPAARECLRVGGRYLSFSHATVRALEGRAEDLKACQRVVRSSRAIAGRVYSALPAAFSTCRLALLGATSARTARARLPRSII